MSAQRSRVKREPRGSVTDGYSARALAAFIDESERHEIVAIWSSHITEVHWSWTCSCDIPPQVGYTNATKAVKAHAEHRREASHKALRRTMRTANKSGINSFTIPPRKPRICEICGYVDHPETAIERLNDDPDGYFAKANEHWGHVVRARRQPPKQSFVTRLRDVARGESRS